LYVVAPAEAVHVSTAWALPGAAARPAGGAGEATGVAEAWFELPLSPPAFTAVTT
jgi:hypothetical protein